VKTVSFATCGCLTFPFLSFGLDGCEVMIPGMKELIDHAADLGVSSVVIGMAHRGTFRL
jgi:2-oxoglutarate dehydrogenase complex dehydrogenase (E1) component-like enzyme